VCPSSNGRIPDIGSLLRTRPARSDLAISSAKSKGSLALTRSMAYHLEVQHAIADMVIEPESIGPHLDTIARECLRAWTTEPGWPLKIFSAKSRAVEGGWRIVDVGLEVSGGAGIFPSAGYKRLIRDVRLGWIHPSNSFLTHEVVAKTALGISLDEQPR
jgi:alkylation response protein AidB-like acyl-CoA dehydrogenase